MQSGVQSRGVDAWSQSASTNEVDVRSLGRSLWARKWWVIAPTLIVGLLTLLAVNIISPRYKGEAKIQIEGRENVFLRPEAEKSVDRAAADQEAVATQVQVLQSRDVARQVIRDLKLGDRPDFDPVLSGLSPSSLFLSYLGLGKDRLKMSPEERVMEAYFDRLTVSAIEKSRVINIEFQSGDAELSARVANGIVDAYLKVQRASKQEQNRGASDWLAGEIEGMRTKVAEADGKVEDFRSKSNIFVGNNNTNLANQQLAELTSALAAARGQKADLDAKSRLIRDMLKTGKPVESADIVNSDLLKRLVEQRVLLRAQLAEQSSTLLGMHPRIQELNSQINALDTQTRGELQRLVRSLENDATIAGARVETVNASLDRLKKQIGSASGQDVQLRALEREAKAQRDLLESYLARYREATARDNIEASPADARIISRATVSNVPSFPKKLPILLIAMLATALVMSAFILSSAILNQTSVRSVPVAAVAPVVPVASRKRESMFAGFRRKERTVPKVETPVVDAPSIAPQAPKAEAMSAAPIEDLAQALRRIGDAGRRVTVVGTARNVGTTFTALGLARALAAQGARVVLIDLAMKAPNLSIISIDPDAPGFAELVRGTASFGDIITRDKFSRVHLIATGKPAGEGAALLASPRLATTLEALARTYDHVVIDAGAMTETAIEPFARIAPRAVLVATDLAHPATIAARDQLTAAGFTDVTLLLGTPGAMANQAMAQPAAA